MNQLERLYNNPCCEDLGPKQVESPSILSTLKRKKMGLQEQLDIVNAALEAMEKNPEIAKVFELITRAR